MAASRLLAAVIACRSPVKWRFRSSIGTTCAYPPPAAPPLTPNTGPSDASRRHSTGFRPSFPSPCVSETDVVVFPSPAGVGVIAVTLISFASGRSASRSMTDRSTFALYRPYGSTSSCSRPSSSAMSPIGRSVADCAISRLEGMVVLIGVLSVAHGGGGQLGDERIGVEAVQREGRDQVGRLPARDQLGKGDADDRRRLEAVRPPPRRHVEVVDLRLAEDRAVVGREVAETGPRAQDLRALELRKELDGMRGGVLDERQRSRRAVRRVGLDLRTDQELAAVRL